MPIPKVPLPVLELSKPTDNNLLIGYWVKWVLLSGLVGATTGTASAIFLVLLDLVTQTRNQFFWLILFLPVAGLLIGWASHFFERSSVSGNLLLVKEIKDPSSNPLPWVMAPFILVSTLLTHLVGGSAGREGTAAQMGGALADQYSNIIKFSLPDKRTLLICGVSGGFASVFGTPWAGAIFGLEVAPLGKNTWRSLIPSLVSAFVADAVTTAWGVGHTSYPFVSIPGYSWLWLGAAVVAGTLFGSASRLFIWTLDSFSILSKKLIAYSQLRPVLGGLLVLALTYLVGTTRYLGLGIPVLEESFVHGTPPADFLFKILFTAISLGFGFKGGEVTPLFFIGATLGNALFNWLPLPLELIVAMGFVAVFAGAANTPLACVVMGMELFGMNCGFYVAIACLVAFLVSPTTSIYGQQKKKGNIFAFVKRKDSVQEE